MPLSEHEQRMLDEIERALYEDDPKFATSVNVSRIRRRRPIVAGCLFVAGLVALGGGGASWVSGSRSTSDASLCR